MGQTVQVIIYIYIGVCIAMLVFNGIFAVSRRASLHHLNRRSEKLEDMILLQITLMQRGEPLSPRIQKHIFSQLHTSRGLMAFHGAVTRIREQQPDATAEYLRLCRPQFLGLAVGLRHNDMKKAYFAYLMAQYRIERDMPHSALSEIMIEFACSPNAYCRENALKALYSFGSAENVVAALLRLDQLHIHHHSKLLSDGLASFSGDHEKLCSLLWQQYPRMSPDLRLVFVNYARLVSGNFCAEFLELLENPREDKEVRLAAIRYFRRYRYDPALPVLLRFVSEDAGTDWEYAAIAALSLRTYPGEETAAALKAALSSPHWYVRFNAADSLGALGLTRSEAQEIYNGGDRYAREMLAFRMNETRARKGEKGV